MEQIKDPREIKGMRQFDVCNERAKDMEKRHAAICRREENLRRELAALSDERARLRIEEVHNVMDYVRTYANSLEVNDVDNYLCHCQNKLAGNIDGCFLTFTDPTVMEVQ